MTIFLIAIGLAMDAFAVSIGLGIKDTREKLKLALKAGGLFSFFQMLMPLIGFELGLGFRTLISDYDHWVAFLLLAGIGAKMIYEGLSKKCNRPASSKTTRLTFFLLAIATSIDALAVGLGFAFLEMSILFPVLIIGVVTFVLSFVGVLIGKELGCRMQSRAEIFGGLVLLFIGLKILIQHSSILW